LAVEEHFYLVLSVFIFMVVRYQSIGKKRFMIIFLSSLIVLSFAMRYYVSYPHRHDAIFGFVQTHLRADGILMLCILQKNILILNQKSPVLYFSLLLY